jgi:NAD(P)H-quinone oxidoreductase subunit 5
MFFSHLFSLSWLLVLATPLAMLALSRSGVSWPTLQKGLAVALLLAVCHWFVTVGGLLALPPHSVLFITSMNATLLVLVLFLAFIIIRYALSNLEGEAGQQRFLQWILLVVFSVMVTLASNHLLVFFLAWVGISLSLHQLLMFYPERPRAALAAHKKFILARTAEVLLASAFILLYSQHQTFFINELLAHYPAEHLSWQEQAAALLLALVALIKCAQLPVHGWLIQVVEAPTPVSALLHAGVINLGGFLLLAFAPLFSSVSSAQWLVLVVAGISTVLSALIMMTRISIKVRLAWSTTTQMGLMLVECALGLYELALLHLLAHSCYKAHAFLNAGEAVNHHLQARFVAAAQTPFKFYLFSGLIVLGLLASLHQLLMPITLVSPWLFIGVALTVLMATRLSVSGLTLAGFSGAFALISSLLVAYLVLKTAMGFLLPEVVPVASTLSDVWISSLLLLLVSFSLLLQHFPGHSFSQRLFIALNAGLYLDEAMTRFTLLIWPKRLPKTNLKAFRSHVEVSQ